MTHGMDVRDKARETVSTQKKMFFRNVPINGELERKNDIGRWRRQIIVLVLRDP